MKVVKVRWLFYGNAEYHLSIRLRPQLLTDPNRFKKPLRKRHCEFSDVYSRLSHINFNVANRLQ